MTNPIEVCKLRQDLLKERHRLSLLIEQHSDDLSEHPEYRAALRRFAIAVRDSDQKAIDEWLDWSDAISPAKIRLARQRVAEIEGELEQLEPARPNRYGPLWKALDRRFKNDAAPALTTALTKSLAKEHSVKIQTVKRKFRDWKKNWSASRIPTQK